MTEQTVNILIDVAQYYSSKLHEHGHTPLGVDWNGKESQTLRFEQLSNIIKPTKNFSVNDLGCGYGALYDFLSHKCGPFSYCGIDISEDMINASRQRLHTKNDVRFLVSSEPDRVADYGIASGVFNVSLGRSDEEWWSYLEATLDILDRTSRVGFAFNCLTSYSDSDKMRSNLYYADPGRLFDLCKRRYSKNVALLHDYALYEFTIHVRKAI